jgi:hypothetical protein
MAGETGYRGCRLGNREIFPQEYFTTYLPHLTEFLTPVTERLILCESRRRPVCAAVALCIVLVGVLLAAGCASQSAVTNQTSNTTVTVTTAPLVATTSLITPIPTACPHPANGSYWIKINPISEIHRGDQIFITGITTLPKETPLELSVFPSFRPHQKCTTTNLYSRPIKIDEGIDCTNTFSTSFDTTGIYPDKVMLTVRSSVNTSIFVDDILTIAPNITSLMLPAAILNASGSDPIEIIPLHDVKKGEIQSIYGLTTLKSPILFSVYDIPKKRELVSGAIDPIDFRQNQSWFSSGFNTSDFEAGAYIVDISAVCSDEIAKGWFNVTT